MKTINNRDGVVVEKFDDIYEFADTIASRLPSPYMKDRASHREDGSGWYGTETYDEADLLLQVGYEKGVQAINNVTSILNNGEERITRVAPVGAVPHVPNFLRGCPSNMIYRQRLERPKKIINIFYDRGASSNVSSDDITTASARLLDLVEFLECRAYSVNLYVGSATVFKNCVYQFGANEIRTVRILSIKIKDARTNSTNRRKVAYLLVHPSFLRRHEFRWMETHPALDPSSNTAVYGWPLYVACDTFEKRRQFYIDHGVLTPTDYYFDLPTLRDLSTSDEILPLLNHQSKIA